MQCSNFAVIQTLSLTVKTNTMVRECGDSKYNGMQILQKRLAVSAWWAAEPPTWLAAPRYQSLHHLLPACTQRWEDPGKSNEETFSPCKSDLQCGVSDTVRAGPAGQQPQPLLSVRGHQQRCHSAGSGWRGDL